MEDLIISQSITKPTNSKRRVAALNTAQSTPFVTQGTSPSVGADGGDANMYRVTFPQKWDYLLLKYPKMLKFLK